MKDLIFDNGLEFCPPDSDDEIAIEMEVDCDLGYHVKWMTKDQAKELIKWLQEQVK